MTIEEFARELNDDTLYVPSGKEFEKICTVYMYHPLINSKKDIANMFKIGGMVIINDMLPRAEKLKELDEKMRKLKNQLSDLSDCYNELKTI